MCAREREGAKGEKESVRVCVCVRESTHSQFVTKLSSQLATTI